MSYDIVYKKTFLKVETLGDEPKYVPMVEIGPSNVTEDHCGFDGRVYTKRVREWFPIFSRGGHICMTEDQMLKVGSSYGDESFVYCGKWFGGSNIKSFIHSGCQHAMTFEEMDALEPYFSHHLQVNAQLYKDHSLLDQFSGYAKDQLTLAQLINAEEDWAARGLADGGRIVLNCSTCFGEIRKHKIATPKIKPDTYYVLYLPNYTGYLMKLSRVRFWYVRNPERAKWFSTRRAAERYLNQYHFRFSGVNSAEIEEIHS